MALSFGKRVRFYFIGFGMGILLSVLIFGSRGCDWTPGNRVIKQIATSQILISDSVYCVLKANNIATDDVFKILENDGDVVFSESRPQAVPKTYVIENTQKHFSIVFTVRSDSVSLVSGVHKGKQGECAAADTAWHIFKMPPETIKRILKAKEISTSDSVLASMKQQGVKESEIYNMIGAGTIDFEKSTPLSKPYAVYVVDYQNYRFTIEMAEKKTRILEFGKK